MNSNCSYKSNADSVGSINVMACGLRVSGLGETFVGKLVEQATNLVEGQLCVV